jgi:hypothetical protein
MNCRHDNEHFVDYLKGCAVNFYGLDSLNIFCVNLGIMNLKKFFNRFLKEFLKNAWIGSFTFLWV